MRPRQTKLRQSTNGCTANRDSALSKWLIARAIDVNRDVMHRKSDIAMSANFQLDLHTVSEQLANQADANNHFSVRFSFNPMVGTDIQSTVQIRQRSLIIDYKFLCCGHDLLQFCEALRRLHARDVAQAVFINEEGNVRIALSIADVGRGWHNVAVDLEQSIQDPFSKAFSQSRLTLNGFGIDQSYLPELFKRITRFLTDWRIPVSHPMM